MKLFSVDSLITFSEWLIRTQYYFSSVYIRHVKDALSVLILCAPVFMFTSGSSALLGLSIDLTFAACHIQYTFLSLCQFFFMRKWEKHENTQSPPFSYDMKMAANGYWLCLNHTNGKDNSVRLRPSSGTIGEDGLKPKPNPNTKPNLEKESKERNLEKGGKKDNLPDSQN